MPRQSRQLQPGYSYHVTTRCNNREFRLTRIECRQVLLYAMKKAQDKYRFKLYGLCIMSNHVHYLMDRIKTGGVSPNSVKSVHDQSTTAPKNP